MRSPSGSHVPAIFWRAQPCVISDYFVCDTSRCHLRKIKRAGLHFLHWMSADS